MNLPLLTDAQIQHLGWTLVQFLWQGTLIAVLFAGARALLGRRMPPQARYALACVTLAVMTAAPVLTFLLGARMPAAAASTAWPLPTAAAWGPVMPWLVVVWLAGVTCFTLRLIGGLRVTARLRSTQVRPAPDESQRLFDDLAGRLRLTRPVRLLVSSLVDVPMVIGWLRPVVLVPVGALTGLPPAHVTALLAHELAHVRRLDYPINLLQRGIEALLFYHPAVWWVSDQIRVEREMCCDDIAVGTQGGDVLTYARALAELESCRRAHTRGALAADGPSLLHRIRRLLGHTPPLSHTLPAPGTAATMTLVWLIGIGAVAVQTAASGTRASSPGLLDALSVVTAPSAAPAILDRSTLLSAVLLGPVGPAPDAQLQLPTAQAPAPGLPLPPAPRSTDPPPQTGTGVIRGRVLDRDTGAPLSKVRVTLRATGVSRLPQALTDASGYYELDDLPPASFTVTASKGGHVTLEYGQRRPGERARPVILADAETASEVDFALPRGGVIAGYVLDEAGEPLAGAVVQAVRERFDAGRRQAGTAVATDVTDDRGQFRLFGLPQGTFLLSATPSDPGTPEMLRIARATSGPGNVATFYPNTLLPALAQPLAIDAGGQLGGLVLQIVPHRPLSISGIVRTSDGTAPPDVALSIGQLGAQGWTGIQSPIAVDGSFSVKGLTPGEYAVTARRISETGQIATERVVLDAADAVVTLTLGPGYDVRGRIAFESESARSAIDPSTVRVLLEALDAMPLLPFRDRATLGEDWRFEASGLRGRYRLRVTLPEGWAVKRVQHDGIDYTDTPLEVRTHLQGVDVLLTPRVTTVTGRVTDDRGRTVTDATVVVLADDPERWGERTRFVQTARPDQNGQFTVRALPPAEYVAVALEYLESGDETNPNILAQLRTLGTRFTLREGGTENMTLRVTAAP